MSEEYIHIEEHKKLLDAGVAKGIMIWELERLCRVHEGDPQTLQVLQILLGQLKEGA